MEQVYDNVYTIYFISFLAFVAVILLIEGGYYLWNSLGVERSQKINRRFRALSAGGVSAKHAVSLLDEKQFSTLPWLNRLLARIPRMHALDRSIEQAGIDVTVSRFILMLIVISLALIIGLSLVVNFPLYIIIPFSTVLSITFFVIFIASKQTRRKKKFTEQLPDTMDFISRSLRAGNPFSSALLSVSKEMPEPTADEFAITFDELNYGLDLEAALHNLGKRTGSEEVRYFITAALIQRQTGGNLADVLNRISAVMRSRVNTRREIQVLAAEMELSAKVLIGLPIFIAAALMVVNPDYLKILIEHELGLVIIGLQMVLMAVGYAIIKKMINFRV